MLSQFSTLINLQPTLWCSIKATKPFVLNISSSDIFKNQLMVKYIGKTMSFSTSKLNDDWLFYAHVILHAWACAQNHLHDWCALYVPGWLYGDFKPGLKISRRLSGIKKWCYLEFFIPSWNYFIPDEFASLFLVTISIFKT